MNIARTILTVGLGLAMSVVSTGRAQSAGFEVDLASETGSCGFDDVSLTPPFLSGSDHAILNSPKHPFMDKIQSQLKKAADLKKEDYGFFFASAGHSALYDYLNAKALKAIAADIWAPTTAGRWARSTITRSRQAAL